MAPFDGKYRNLLSSFFTLIFSQRYYLCERKQQTDTQKHAYKRWEIYKPLQICIKIDHPLKLYLILIAISFCRIVWWLGIVQPNTLDGQIIRYSKLTFNSINIIIFMIIINVAILAYIGYKHLLIECTWNCTCVALYAIFTTLIMLVLQLVTAYQWPNYKLEDVVYIGLYGGCNDGSVLAMRFAVMHADCWTSTAF